MIERAYSQYTGKTTNIYGLLPVQGQRLNCKAGGGQCKGDSDNRQIKKICKEGLKMSNEDLDELGEISTKISACGVTIDLVLPNADELYRNDRKNISSLLRELLDRYSHRIEAIMEKEIAYNAEKRKALTQAKTRKDIQR